MEGGLREKLKILNELLKKTAVEEVSFDELTETLGNVVNANVYIAELDGKILSYTTVDRFKCGLTYSQFEETYLPMDFAEKLLGYTDTVENEYDPTPMCTYGDRGPCVYKDRYLTIVPIAGLGKRIGTLFFSKYGGKFNDDDNILCDYSSAIVVMELLRYVDKQRKKDEDDVSAARKAISTLSYSEMQAVKLILDMVETEGLIVASTVSREAQITRSVVSNALKKLESANIIETRSLGMKGTHIKILNLKMKEEIKK